MWRNWTGGGIGVDVAVKDSEGSMGLGDWVSDSVIKWEIGGSVQVV